MRAFENNKIKMPVLKIYFKVLKKNLRAVIIYAGIFLLIAAMLTKYGNNNSNNMNFQETKTDIAFINYDGNTPITSGLKTYLSGNANFINVKDDSQSLQDALFFRRVEYIVKIPKGFTQDFLSGGSAKIDKTTIAESESSVYIDSMISRYLSTVQLFQKNIPGISQARLALLVKNNLSVKAKVTLNSYDSQANKLSIAASFFTVLVYAFMCIIFMSISSMMQIFNKSDLRRRTLSSPLRPTSMKFQLFLGHFAVTLAVWLCGMILAVWMCGTDIIGSNFALMCANSLCFAISALSLSFLIGGIVSTRGTQNAIANVLSLGMSFTSGVFVPQQYLSASLLNVAHFLPSYWYIKAVNDISGLVTFSTANLSPIIYAMLIELGFAVAFFAISLVLGKKKSSVNV